MTPRRARVGPLLAACTLLAPGCGGPSGAAKRPTFAPPRHGVFRDPVPIVKSTDDDLLPSIVPASNVVVYAAKAGSDGNLDIYVRPLEGGAAVRLTTHSADDTDPELSPDGRRIAWCGQSEDVKGDIWAMDVDGSDKTQLTGRSTADSAPSWSPDGKTIYFTSRVPGAAVPRVDAIDVESGARRTLVERGWDPVVSPAGDVLLFVALDDRPRPRIYAQRLRDGRVAAVTDGAYIEGLPKVARGASQTLVLFTRWVDDQTNDGLADADDSPSLWSVEVDDAVFAGEQPSRPRPLTPGEGGEIFASVVSDWLVYTRAGRGDLEIYALPADGVINTSAGAEAILAAARAEENPSLRRLALRYVVATSPDLRASARYELARELAERARWSDALDELERVEKEAAGTELAVVAALERERLRVLRELRGDLVIREDKERRFVEQKLRAIDDIIAAAQSGPPSRARAATVRAELAYALGQRVLATEVFRGVAQDESAPPEDGARALDRLGEIYAGLGSLESVASTSEQTLRRFSAERYYAGRAADRWVKSATESVGLSDLAALERIVSGYADLPAVVARAAVALASAQERQRHEEVALRQWRAIAASLTAERAVLSKALIRLGEVAERQGDQTEATAAYERLIAEFPENPRLRAVANRGITRINLLQARREEETGDLEKARESYGRVLRANRTLVLAHRRFIALSARLGMLDRVVESYEREAEARPRDKLARYGYGYALTFLRPVPLRAAEREIIASLTLDPRFAAGHLTLGWLRERRELEDERAGWLEKADQSYDTARELVDGRDQPEIWAAAHLNRGNVLFKLGQTDDAFEAYLTRELSGVPFHDRITELLFREHFSRAALREGAYDVALDMAKLGEALSRELPGTPRRGSMAALVGAVSLQASMYEDATRWYSAAAKLYTEREDWVRVVPMLRGKLLAERLVGRNDEALETARQLLRILARGDGPVEPVHGLVANLLRGEVVTEVPATEANVTRAVYGFDSAQEEEIVRAASSRIFAERGDFVAAREFDEQRLELVRRAASDSRIGPRIQRELLLALHSSTLLAIRAGEMDTAMLRAGETLRLAQTLEAWGVAVPLLEAVAHAWLRAPEQRTGERVALARTVAAAGLDATSDADPALSGRFARWLAIDHLVEARQPPALEAESRTERLSGLLAALDRSVAAAKEAADTSRLAVTEDRGDPDLSAHLQAYSGEKRPAARQPDDEVVRSAPLSWRWRFDRALWERAASARGPDPTWLRAAIEAFEHQPMPAAAPELGAFLYEGVELLRADDDIERAWRLLERARLLDMVPPARRVTREPLASAWAAVRELRDDPSAHAKELAGGSQLLRALEAMPATAAAVSRALGNDAVLVQAFAPLADHWYWFVVDEAGVRLATTEPYAGDDLASILAGAVSEEPESKPATLYFDAGELIETPAIGLRWAAGPLIEQFEVSEALSATYLVAAAETRNLASEDILSLGAARQEHGVIAVPPEVASLETLERFGRGRLLIHFNLEVEPRGTKQVVFEVPPGTLARNRLDLDTIAGVTLDGTMALVERAPISAAAARDVAQALLIAGIPTVAIGQSSAGSDALRADLIERIAFDRPATVVAERARTAPLPMRLIGDRGLTAKQRVTLAATTARQLISPAAKAFNAARDQQDSSLWRAAQKKFARLLETVTFLRRPASFELMPPSKLKNALLGLELLAQANLAQTHLALDEVEEAAALQELIVRTHAGLKARRELANDYLALGKTLSKREPLIEDAAEAFSNCAGLAAELKEALLEADCRSRLGSMLRTLRRYDAAVDAYRQAITLFAENGSNNEVYPHRYLGFLYADVLNNYDRAMEEFRSALRIATKAGMTDMAPRLVVDIARVQRQRGEYEQALAQVRAGEAMLREASAEDKSEAALEEAKIYWYRGNYRRALEHQRRGLELARAAGDTFREIQATSLAGLIALNQGELELAERQIRAALDLSRSTQRRSEQATQLNNLGIIQREAGRVGEAIASFEQALAIDEELGNAEGRAYDLRNLAIALQRKGEQTSALGRLTEALEESRQIGNTYNELQCLFAIGETLDALRRPGAQEMYSDATELARRTSVPEVEWRSLYALGRHAEQRGNTSDARALYDQALAVAERLGRGRSESSAQNSRDDLYADAIRTAIDAGDVQAAYLYLERSRARALLDVLATRTIEMPGAEPKNLLDAELKTRELRVAAARDLALGIEESARRLEETQAAHQAAMAALRAAYPRLARAFTIDPVSLRALSSRLPEGVVVVSFFVGRQSTTALVISRDTALPLRISVGREGLARRVARVRKAMRAFGSVEADLASLSQSLVEPLRQAISGAKIMVVIPHGPLHHVPFAALTLDSVPLIERMVIARALSASMLADSLAQPLRPPVRRIVAVAAGSDLPFAPLEVRAIAGTTAVVGEAATEQLVRTARADALDIAAHTDLDAREPLGSAILLSPAGGHDGRLEVNEVFSLTSLPPLVTLSACDSRGSRIDGSEWLGLGGAFLTAGAQSVVASSNRVSDLAAAVVMKRFYRALRSQPAGEALRQAALSVRRYFPHPSHWASFVLLGDFR